jgi:hypothetical protein
VLNATSGAFTVTFANTTSSTPTYAIPQATSTYSSVISNGSNGVIALAAVAGGVTSFNSRTGAVVPATGDYGVAQVTGAAPLASPTFTGTPAAPTASAGTSTTQLATTAFVATSFAPLASPTFTGTPAAPTATAGTNTTQLATTAFVTTAVSNAGASYAPLASPTFTGTPAAPTAAIGTDTTQLATTAFVFNATQASVSVALTGTSQSLTATQYGSAVIILTGTLTANFTLTFPSTGAWQVYNATTNNPSTSFFTVTATNTGTATLVLPQGAACDIIGNTSLGILPVQPAAITTRMPVAADAYAVNALGSVSGTVTLNNLQYTEFTATITGATTFAFTAVPPSGYGQVVYIRMTNGGSAAITWPSGTLFAGGTAPTYTASGTDLLSARYDSTAAVWTVFTIGLNLLT